MHKLIILLLISICFSYCSAKKNSNSISEKMNTQRAEMEEQEMIEIKPCNTGNQTVDTLEGKEATVVFVANEYMFFFDYTRLIPCNMPEECKKKDLTVIISGNILPSPPNVRMAGSPFEITSIKIKN